MRPEAQEAPGRAVVSGPPAHAAAEHTAPAHTAPADEVSPEELAKRAQGGCRDSYGELVLRLQGPLFHFLSLRMADRGEAEELVQEAFLRGWQKLHHYDSRWRFSTWIFTVAKRLAASRARTRRPVMVQDEVLSSMAGEGEPSASVELKDESDNIWLLAGRVLSVEQRSAMWLRYGEDLSIEEIARILGKRRVTVRVLLFRAREALAGHLKARHPDGARS